MPSPRNKLMIRVLGALAVLIAAGAAVFAEYRYEKHDLRQEAEAITGGNVERGKLAFSRYGCGGCHTVSGVPQANGLVGPPLSGVGARAIIGGRLENKPSNLMLWISHPQQVAPGTAMPDLGVSPAEARDIAAFLYTNS